jgi:dTDP-4-dehydro-6-deoxy-alpha-D-glucopyranose 2,3-dehydratase
MTSASSSLAHPETYDAARLTEFFTFLESARSRLYTRVQKVPLEGLTAWSGEPDAAVIGHVSGKFFTIQGIDVRVSDRDELRWSQPIILQPEIGILGILVKEFDGVPHCLMQLKAEPGNCNGIQLSPTVQATRSNYTRVHGGSAVPYLDYFLERDRHRVISDVRQSEQGSWFLQKRNRNMIVEVTEDIEVLDGFHWLTIGQIHALLRVDDLVNMDARSVLSCLPFLEMMPATVALDELRTARVPAMVQKEHVEARVAGVRRHSPAIPIGAEGHHERVRRDERRFMPWWRHAGNLRHAGRGWRPSRR